MKPLQYKEEQFLNTHVLCDKSECISVLDISAHEKRRK